MPFCWLYPTASPRSKLVTTACQVVGARTAAAVSCASRGQVSLTSNGAGLASARFLSSGASPPAPLTRAVPAGGSRSRDGSPSGPGLLLQKAASALDSPVAHLEGAQPVGTAEYAVRLPAPLFGATAAHGFRVCATSVSFFHICGCVLLRGGLLKAFLVRCILPSSLHMLFGLLTKQNATPRGWPVLVFVPCLHLVHR